MKKLLIAVVLASLLLVSVACNTDSDVSEEEQLYNEILSELTDEEYEELMEAIEEELGDEE